MSEGLHPQVAIVDFGMGNLFSVKLACEHAGMRARITTSDREDLESDAVILPGVGAFGDAMTTLRKLGLVETIQNMSGTMKPLVGICLGMQLFMRGSHEFGWHEGIGIIEGEVVRFEVAQDEIDRLKVPQVGWNRICQTDNKSWDRSLLEGLPDGEFMYFVHSFYAKPSDSNIILSTTRYGETEFCSSLRYRNVFGCQFHPERSGLQGLRIYRNLAAHIKRSLRAVQRASEVDSQA